jgi:hypothetical protein
MNEPYTSTTLRKRVNILITSVNTPQLQIQILLDIQGINPNQYSIQHFSYQADKKARLEAFP